MSDDSGTPLGVWLDRLADEAPDVAAIICDGVTLTRRELAVNSNRLARRFLESGVEPGSMVTIGLPNSIAFYEATVAAWKIGAVPQPISSRMPPAELAAIVEVVDPALVLGIDPGDGRPWLPLGYSVPTSYSAEPLPPIISPSWKAPTSGGSTGRPKLIVSTTPGIAERVVASARTLRLEQDDIFLCTAPLSHNAPFGFSCTALMLGGTVVVMPRFDAKQSLELVQRHRATWMYLVPTMMQRILKLGDERFDHDLSSVRVFYHLAAPCPAYVKEAWIDWVGPERIVEMYAGTEALAVTVITGSEWLDHRGSVGRVVSGEMIVLDDDGAPQLPGQVGEIWMRPPPGVKTYQYVGATARSRDGWESLGDMGSFDTDGFLFLADRRQDMVLVGGANVYPAEVEAALSEHPQILSSCVIGLPDADLGNLLHAIVETRGEVTDEQLRSHLVERLSPYKIPRTFERSSQPLRDDAGKVRRSALREERLAKGHDRA
jgi:bile acid-coenzyme A ligase